MLVSKGADGRSGCQSNSTEDCCKHLVTLVPCTQCANGASCCIQSQPTSGNTSYILTPTIVGYNPADPIIATTINRCDYRVGVCTGQDPLTGKPCMWPPPKVFNATCTHEFRQGAITCNKVP